MKKFTALLALALFWALQFYIFLPPRQIKASADADFDVRHVINSVVLVEFANSKGFPEGYVELLEKSYNTSKIGVRNYFIEQSLGKLDITTNVVTSLAPVRLKNEESYYRPRYEYNELLKSYREVNPNGYDNRFYRDDGTVANPEETGVKRHIDGFMREQLMVEEIVDGVKNYDATGLDENGDGYCDILSIILDCAHTRSDKWNEVLWPHMSKTYAYNAASYSKTYYVPSGYITAEMKNCFKDTRLSGLETSNYTLFTTGYLGEDTLMTAEGKLLPTGVLCHETYHGLGMYDYYSYEDSAYNAVGDCDIMGETNPLPQMSLSYLRYKMGWLDEGKNILPIDEDGYYTLYPTSSANEVKAYKLVLDDYRETGEYFMFEVRSNKGSGFDGQLHGSGLIVYRVNERNGFIDAQGEFSPYNYGNMYGDDEVFVYRLGANETYTSKYGGVSFCYLDGTSDARYSLTQYVDKSTIGSADKSAYKTFNYKKVVGDYKGTTVYYSSGINSGIVVEDIKLNADDSVTFMITFPQNDGVTVGDVTGTVKKYYDGKKKIATWSSGLRGGTVEIIGFPSKKLVSYVNNRATAYLPTAEELGAKVAEGVSAEFSKTVPSSFCQTFIPDCEETSLAVYALVTDASGEKSAIWLGIIEPEKPSFFEYLITSPLWMGLLTGCLVVLLAGSVILYIACFRAEKKRMQATAETFENDYEAEYGERYWEATDAEAVVPTATDEANEIPDSDGVKNFDDGDLFD